MVFLGSVFFTSEKFIETENDVKFYFTVISLLVCVIIFLLRNNHLNQELRKLTSLSTQQGLFIVGVLQGIYGVLQYLGIYPSNHNAFNVTGSFNNPAGFMGVLALLFPIGVYWCIKAKGLEQRLVFFSLGLILFSIILAGSRTGIIAVVIPSIVIIIIEFHLVSKIKRFISPKLIILFTLILLLGGLLIMYKLRVDSANGRLLVWKVSTDMIKDKPLVGHGYKGFQAKYMDYQAEYFNGKPNSRFRQLADNVIHPFNEFIKIGVNYGIIGLFFYLLLLSFILHKIVKTEHSFKSILLGCYIAFIILSCFSYPLQYVPIWLLLGYYTLVLMLGQLSKLKFSVVVRISIIGMSAFGIVFLTLRMNHELKWKNIALKSLQGQTKQSLVQYEKLYPYLKGNAQFLYNYSAELNVANHYKESLSILSECQNKFNDYDVQMLLADNYYHLGDTASAIKIYHHAGNMIPSRFMPLYKLFEISLNTQNIIEANEIAKEIVNKPIKVRSATLDAIIESAKSHLTEENLE